MSDAGFDLGHVGIWTRELDRLPMAEAQAAARELEDLGYRTLWLPEVIGREPLANAALLLSGTRSLVVATGVANIYARSAVAMGSGWKTLTEAFPDRFVLGVGVGVKPIVEGVHGRTYAPPYSTMVQYLEAMEQGVFVAAKPTTPRRLVLAALRPRLLALAAERAFGSLGYFVPVAHTAWAREVVGRDSQVLIEQAVVVESDPVVAREIARRYLATYLALPVYTDHLRQFGWTDDDIASPPDARVDELVAWGPPGAIAERVDAHLEAGADHVCLQVVAADPREVPRTAWRDLAPAVLAR
jgi:probable F420-dependent oxidoreductase